MQTHQRTMQTHDTTMPPQETRYAEIRKRAYQLWEEADRPAGKDLTFWLSAEAQIDHEAAGLPPSPEAAASKVHLNGRFPAPSAPEESRPRSPRQPKQNRSVRLTRRATATTF